MNIISDLSAVTGSARTAASARPRLLAPRPWTTGAGVCPAPIQHMFDGTGTGGNGRLVGSYELYLQSQSTFEKHYLGSRAARPPL